MTTMLERMQSAKVLPVVLVESVDHAIKLSEALLRGGINTVEITLRTSCAIDAMKAVKESVPGVTVCAGTITRQADLDAVAEAGVDFAVSPGMTVNLIRHAQEIGMPFLPGLSTPSEMMAGMELGLDAFKLFPATAVGGYNLLKAIASPLAGINFCPTGGLNPDNFTDFLALPNVACIGGSWMASPELMNAGEWGKIEEIARQTMAKIN